MSDPQNQPPKKIACEHCVPPWESCAECPIEFPMRAPRPGVFTLEPVAPAARLDPERERQLRLLLPDTGRQRVTSVRGAGKIGRGKMK